MPLEQGGAESTAEMLSFFDSQKETQLQQNVITQPPHVSLNIDNSQISSDGEDSEEDAGTSTASSPCSERTTSFDRDKFWREEDKYPTKESVLARETEIIGMITMGDYWGATRCDMVEMSDHEDVDEEQRKSDMVFIDELCKSPNDAEVRYKRSET